MNNFSSFVFQVSKTPAHYAAENGHGHVLKLLIEVGQADINAKDNVSYIMYELFPLKYDI